VIAPSGPEAFVKAVVSGAASEVARVVQPAAAAAVATTFGFPLALTLAVFVFVIAQSRLDHRDPKLRNAPRTVADTLVAFEEEKAL
jgi:hypothetical protein